MNTPLLSLNNLTKSFRTGPVFRRRNVQAVRGVSLDLQAGETFGLVGESGCGKSTLGRLAIQLLPATSGSVHFDGQDISSLDQDQLRPVRRNLQIIFQDPVTSLDPRMTVEKILEEPLRVQKLYARTERLERVQAIMEEVGLSAAHAKRYPHEFSGGQRQRIGIARALILQPKLIVADEPVSALDVSVQAQVLNLMQDLQGKYDISYLFISHDLCVVKHISTQVAVMYLGEIVEKGERDSLYTNPMHPYTQALLSTIPGRNKSRQRIVLSGDVPNPANPPPGCPFHTRCPYKMPICAEQKPKMIDHGSMAVSCHLRT